MTVHLRKFLSSPWCAMLCAAMVVATAFATAVHVHATVQEEAAAAALPAPYAEVQFATLSGATNSISVTMLPVVLSNGSVVYKNVTIPIDVAESSTGVVTLTAGALTTVAAPIGTANGFKAGNYTGPGGGNVQLLTLSGPGVTAGGATEWSLSTSAGNTGGCTYPTSATFYVGPLTSNPIYARLKKAGITSTAWSYGIMGNQPCSAGSYWYNGNIIGVSQTGNALTIVSFSSDGAADQPTPVAQITYTFI